MGRIGWPFCALVLLGTAARVGAQAARWEEVRLGPWPDLISEGPVVCPHGWHLAAAASTEAGVQLYYDGELIGPTY